MLTTTLLTTLLLSLSLTVANPFPRVTSASPLRYTLKQATRASIIARAARPLAPRAQISQGLYTTTADSNPNQNGQQYAYYPLVDFPSYDIGIAATASGNAECATRCEANAACLLFVWIPSTTFCYLKSAVSPASNYDTSKSTTYTYVKGSCASNAPNVPVIVNQVCSNFYHQVYPTCPNSGQNPAGSAYAYYAATDFPGYDITYSNAITSLSQCIQRCLTDRATGTGACVGVEYVATTAAGWNPYNCWTKTRSAPRGNYIGVANNVAAQLGGVFVVVGGAAANAANAPKALDAAACNYYY